MGQLVSKINTLFKKPINLPKEAYTKFCQHCGCSMSLLIPSQISNFDYESEEKNYNRPEHCWIRKDSINYQND